MRTSPEDASKITRSAPPAAQPRPTGLRRWTHGAWGIVLAWSALLAGLVMMFEPGAYPGEAGDTRLNLYMLEHGYRWVVGHDPAFWHAPFFHPAPLAFAYSENHLGTLPLYAVMRSLGSTPDGAFAVWMMAMFTLNFAAAGFALVRLGASIAAAAAGAFVFAFGLPVMMQTGHPQLLPRLFVPLALLAFTRLAEGGGTRAFAALAAAFVAQCYAGMYIGWFLGLALAACVAAGALIGRSAFLAHMFGRSNGERLVRLLVVASAGIALLPLALPYAAVYAASAASSTEALGQLSVLTPEPSAFLHTTGSAWVWGALEAFGRDLPMAHEKRLFVGALPLAALVGVPFVLRTLRDRPGVRTRVAGFALAFVLLAALVVDVGGVSLYHALAFVPGAGSFRAVGRYLLVALFPLAVVLAAALDAALARVSSRVALAASLGLVLAVVVDQWAWHVPQMTFAESRARVAEVRDAVAPALAPGSAFYFSVVGDPAPHARHVDAMLAAAELGVPTVNGYAARLPPGYPPELAFGTGDVCARLAGWLGRAGRSLGDVVVTGTAACAAPGAAPVTLARGPIARSDLAFESTIDAGPVDCATDPIVLEARLTNRGAARWPAESAELDHRYQVRYAWRLVAPDGMPLSGYDRRGALPHDVGPGESVAVRLELAAQPGERELHVQINVVQEWVHWARDEHLAAPAHRVACR
jgi:hypothetical protein